MKRALVLPAFALLTACGSQAPAPAGQRPNPPAAATPASTPAVTPTPWASGLLVVLRESPATDEVVVADRAGAVKARASFSAPARPQLANAADLLQPPVRVAGGSVFFADRSGVVRRLDGDGRVVTAATFPVTDPSRQELSYAVSPDGTKLMASILTPPPAHVPPATNPSEPMFAAGGRWALELLTADAGGRVVSTLKKDLGTAFPQPTVVVGWDRSGPLATLNTNLAAQDAPVWERFTGEALIHIGPDGGHLDQVGGAGCRPLDELADGTIACDTSGTGRPFQVRSAAGQLLWQTDPGDGLDRTPHLSPGGDRIAAGSALLSRSGAPAALGPAPATPSAEVFQAQGWLDARTVIGATRQATTLTPGNLQLIDAGSPRVARDLPVDGKFAGLLQAPRPSRGRWPKAGGGSLRQTASRPAFA